MLNFSQENDHFCHTFFFIFFKIIFPSIYCLQWIFLFLPSVDKTFYFTIANRFRLSNFLMIDDRIQMTR